MMRGKAKMGGREAHKQCTQTSSRATSHKVTQCQFMNNKTQTEAQNITILLFTPTNCLRYCHRGSLPHTIDLVLQDLQLLQYTVNKALAAEDHRPTLLKMF